MADSMSVCCPYLRHGRCIVARIYLPKTEDAPSLVVVLDRCCGVTPSGKRLWETCNFVLHTADCRYCEHFDKTRSWCRERGKKISYYLGKCEAYTGPRPVPSLLQAYQGA